MILENMLFTVKIVPKWNVAELKVGMTVLFLSFSNAITNGTDLKILPGSVFVPKI